MTRNFFAMCSRCEMCTVVMARMLSSVSDYLMSFHEYVMYNDEEFYPT